MTWLIAYMPTITKLLNDKQHKQRIPITNVWVASYKQPNSKFPQKTARLSAIERTPKAMPQAFAGIVFGIRESVIVGMRASANDSSRIATWGEFDLMYKLRNATIPAIYTQYIYCINSAKYLINTYSSNETYTYGPFPPHWKKANKWRNDNWEEVDRTT